MKLNKFKFSFILILIFFLFSLFNSFILAEERGLEVEYPKIGGEKITTSTTIEEYAAYVFNLSLIIAAIAAFAVLIYGGFRYLTSAGNPLVMDDAKKWIFGGIIGLVLLLCSWLILNIINPEFTQPKVEESKHLGGIYLIDGKGGERHFYSLGTINIPEDFEATQIEFISYPPADPSFDDPNKEELASIFYYEDINEGGDVKRVDNNKALNSPFASSSSPQSLNFFPKSIYFLWQRAGVYLYEKEYHETPPRPKFYTESRKTLKDFSDKAKSIAFVNEKQKDPTTFYRAVLFEDTDYEGGCEFKLTDALIVGLKDKVSSIIVFQGEVPHGDIIFYEKQNCDAKEEKERKIFTPSSGATYDYTTKDLTGLNQWLSIKINGNFSVLLSTEKELKGKCMLFSGVGCIPSFKGTSIYSADPAGFRPVEAWIFPNIE
jgi:hypothetical protein